MAERVLMRDFLAGTLAATRELLPDELRDFQQRLRGPLAQAYYDDPSQHFEVWLRRAAGRVELGLHFESRDRAANERMLEWFSDELGWIKAQLGEGTEAERWDRGWARIHQTLPLPEYSSAPLPRTAQRLRSVAAGVRAPTSHAIIELQHDLARRLARMIELLEPLRRDAARS
jgi:hypothetical protein